MEKMETSKNSKLPWSGIRIAELSIQLTGRLAALLFADQGAEVLILADHQNNKNINEFNVETNDYLNRGKTTMKTLNTDQRNELLKTCDVVIVDGETTEWVRLEKQILLRVCSALPGDKKWGHLPHNCDDDFLGAIVGFYTDMCLSHFLDRKVVYTPLRLCSIYAGVISAVAIGSALVDRERINEGREITTSRLAAGAAAIGALSLSISGPSLPKHLISTKISHKREGVDHDEFEKIRLEAIKNPKKQLWLEQRLYPLATPYECKDGTLFLPMATFNKRLARGLIDHLGLWPKLESMGIVDKNPYDKENVKYATNNLALPLNFSWVVGCEIANELEVAFKQKTAFEWEKEFCLKKIACAEVLSFKQWFENEETRKAKIVANVEGKWQIGRSMWCDSAKPYPELIQEKVYEGKEAVNRLNELLVSKKSSGPLNSENFKKMDDPSKPLKGYVVMDFSNVLAGPAAGRMLAEVGATVYKIGPKLPQHAPVVMVTWQAEEGIGKETIMLDQKSEGGKNAVRKMLEKADIVLANKHDQQLVDLGISRDQLDNITKNGGKGPKLIQLQIAARKGQETKDVEATNWPGYDPALQGKTGLMERFGPEGCPTFHGVASCVDYVTGYTAAFAGISALYAREAKGVVSERCGTSLACVATLMQCTMHGKEPDSRGPWSKGKTKFNRVYQVGCKDKPDNATPENWIYTQADRDLTSEALNWTGSRVEFMDKLSKEGYLSTPVHTCQQIAQETKDCKSNSLSYTKRESLGLITETFDPTWFCFNGKPSVCPLPATPYGSHAPKILMDVCGYTEKQVYEMYDEGILIPIYWNKDSKPLDAHFWPEGYKKEIQSNQN